MFLILEMYETLLCDQVKAIEQFLHIELGIMLEKVVFFYNNCL